MPTKSFAEGVTKGRHLAITKEEKKTNLYFFTSILFIVNKRSNWKKMHFYLAYWEGKQFFKIFQHLLSTFVSLNWVIKKSVWNIFSKKHNTNLTVVTLGFSRWFCKCYMALPHRRVLTHFIPIDKNHPQTRSLHCLPLTNVLNPDKIHCWI